MLKLKTMMSGLLAGGLAIGATGIANAQTVLTISSWAPPTHGMNAIMWPKFTEMLEKATEGRVTAQIKYKLGSPPAQFDLVQDGVGDISWIFHGYTPGRFVATKMIELPGYPGTAEAASVVHWRAHQKFFAKANEHRGVKLLSLMTHGVGVLHSATQISALDQINGMKLRLGGGVAGDVGTAVGATGIRVPAPKVYETLASKAADGVMMPFEGKKSFKLTEVAQHTYEVPGGFYRGSFAIIMNQDRFDSLSAKDQKALGPEFGEAVAKMAGAMWDQIDAAGRAASAKAPDNTSTMANDADAKAWEGIREPIIQKVMAEVDKAGIDAKAAYSFISEQMSSYK